MAMEDVETSKRGNASSQRPKRSLVVSSVEGTNARPKIETRRMAWREAVFIWCLGIQRNNDGEIL